MSNFKFCDPADTSEPENQEFSAAELKLFQALFVWSDRINCQAMLMAFQTHPVSLYQKAAEEVIIRRLDNSAVDALRRALHTLNYNYGKPYRRTKEWDEMIAFEE